MLSAIFDIRSARPLSTVSSERPPMTDWVNAWLMARAKPLALAARLLVRFSRLPAVR
jgi:hypothetical protein